MYFKLKNKEGKTFVVRVGGSALVSQAAGSVSLATAQVVVRLMLGRPECRYGWRNA